MRYEDIMSGSHNFKGLTEGWTVLRLKSGVLRSGVLAWACVCLDVCKANDHTWNRTGLGIL